MAKTKVSNKELRLIIGSVLLLIGLFGFRDIISVLLIIFGGYLIYEGLKKN